MAHSMLIESVRKIVPATPGYTPVTRSQYETTSLKLYGCVRIALCESPQKEDQGFNFQGVIQVKTRERRAGTALADRRISIIYATQADNTDSPDPLVASSSRDLARGGQSRPGHFDLDRQLHQRRRLQNRTQDNDKRDVCPDCYSWG